MPDIAPVLINSSWRPATAMETFQAVNPRTRATLPETFPVSDWADIDAVLDAAVMAAAELRAMDDVDIRLSQFLERYASGIKAEADNLVGAANAETGLPAVPRLKDVELPRTTGQLRQAAAAARTGDWRRPILDTKGGLRSCLAPIGPVMVIGPNNFPFAFNGISGGDFAAAVAAGNPVIAKAHPLHPQTTRLLAEIAHASAGASGLPAGFVQMLYHMRPDHGLRMAADRRLAAIAFTGGRHAGLKLKAAADAAGRLFFGEMSSVNPTVILPGSLADASASIADQLVASITMGSGQFCTKPGLICMMAGEETERFINAVAAKCASAGAGVLFSESGLKALSGALETLRSNGAQCVTGGQPMNGEGYAMQTTLLRATAAQFLERPVEFQTEAFGNAALIVVANNLDELLRVLQKLEGSLTGTVFSSQSGADDEAYQRVAQALRPRVGRLLNDKMPTGVAVSPAQNHGGPYPATSQPHFTAVGLPSSIARFTQLEAYDNVRPHRLPPCLQNKNPTGQLWRHIDGQWTQGDV